VILVGLAERIGNALNVVPVGSRLQGFGDAIVTEISAAIAGQEANHLFSSLHSGAI
jgi:hypothetical protein